MKKKSKRGGYRKNSGRKKGEAVKYKRIPLSKLEIVGKVLKPGDEVVKVVPKFLDDVIDSIIDQHKQRLKS